MEEVPEAFNNAKAFQMEFGVTNAEHYSEEHPVLRYERNGFVFEANLHLFENKLDVRLVQKRPEAFDRDWQVLAGEVQKQAAAELDKRRQEMSELFS